MPDIVAAPVHALVATAMAKNPTHRYPCAAAMAAAAQALAAGVVQEPNTAVVVATALDLRAGAEPGVAVAGRPDRARSTRAYALFGRGGEESTCSSARAAANARW